MRSYIKMAPYFSFTNLFFQYHSFFSWRDSAEIIFFTIVVYSFSVWLKKDRHKNLLGYFYSYCACFFTAQSLQLNTIEYILFYSAPIIVLLFIIFHQITLQKNFVALRSLAHLKEDNDENWLETVIQSCLIALNQNKEVVYVIECTDSLQDHITTPLTLHATVNKELLTILLSSDSCNHDQMIWLNAQGKILGMNCRWKNFIEEQWTSEIAQKRYKWHQDALFYTEKMDAIVFKTTASTQLFDIVFQGKTYKQITASHALSYINHHLIRTTSITKKRNIDNGFHPYHTKKQPHSERSH